MRYNYAILFLQSILMYGCVSSYEPSLTLNADLVVINGIITDQPGRQIITLSRSRSTADSTSSSPIEKATVDVLVDGNPVRLSETSPGSYVLPAAFKGQVGHTYQLRFQTLEGVDYKSSEELMLSVPPILKAYDSPHKGLVSIGDTTIPATDIFVDYQDPGQTANFYLWRWRTYEVQDYCASCHQGRYLIRDVGPLGNGPLEVLGCVVDQSIPSYLTYDYPCRGLCWDIFYSTRLDVFSDVYTNGKQQQGHLVATIPAYQVKPALISIEQLSLSANAYRYYKLFAEQVQNTGTLADSPPAPISGNIKNSTNALENVVGYFSAASVFVQNYKFSRSGLAMKSYIGLFKAQNGRAPLKEQERNNPIFGGQNPSALCLPSASRTDLLPPGW